jgi:hypothetical protein
VVEVEQRSLGALEQHPAPVTQRTVDEEGRVRHVRREPLGVGERPSHDLLDVERVDAVDALEPDVLLARRELDLLAQDLRVEQVLHPDPDPRCLVRVRRPDASSRRPDLETSEPALACPVERNVPGHDQVRVARDEDEPVGAPAASLELVELCDEHVRVDDAACADRARDAAHDPGRDRADLEGLAVDDDCVACVGTTLVPTDEVGLLGEQVDDLSLPLVAPLRADDHGRGHVGHSRMPSGGMTARRRLRPARRTHVVRR